MKKSIVTLPQVLKGEKLGDTELQLSPIQVNEEYLKKWNVHLSGMRGGFLCLTRNGELLRNTLYRKGGMGGTMRDGYVMLLKYVESHYDGDFAKKYAEGRKRHLDGVWVIIDKYGNEKAVEDKNTSGSMYITAGQVYSQGGRYYNIETGEFYCDSSTCIKSDDFIFLDNQFDKDKSKRGVMKINKWDGTYEVFPKS